MKFYIIEAKYEGGAFPALFSTREEAQAALEGYMQWQRGKMFVHDPMDLRIREYRLIGKYDSLPEFLDRWNEGEYDE
jgi:hypothetical protein